MTAATTATSPRAWQITPTMQAYLKPRKLFAANYIHRQIAKCVNECKTQAANAKELFSNIKVVEKHSSQNVQKSNQLNDDYDDDDIGWDSDFDDEEVENEDQGGYSLSPGNGNQRIESVTSEVTLLSIQRLPEDPPEEKENPSILKEDPTSDTISLTPSLSGASDSAKSVSPIPGDHLNQLPTQNVDLPQPPSLPVVASNLKHSGTTTVTHKPKRPSTQPPPPPASKLLQSASSSTSDFGDLEFYEPPLASTSSPEIISSERGVWKVTSRVDSQSLASSCGSDCHVPPSTYEVIDHEEQTYEVVEDEPAQPPPPLTMPPPEPPDCPVLPPRTKGSKSIPPPPPIPDKPHRLQASLPNPPIPISVAPTTIKKSFPKFTAPSFLTKNYSDSKLKDAGSHSRKNSLPILSGSKSSGDSTGVSSVTSNNGSVESLNTLEKSGKSSLNNVTGLTRSSSSLNEDITTRPLPSIPTSVPCAQDGSTALTLTGQEPWFHNVTREEAETRLKAWNQDGGFLVRPSKLAGPDKPYTLSLLYNGTIFNLSIRLRPDGCFALGYQKDKELAFPSIRDIITYHECKPIILTKKSTVAGKTCLFSSPPK